MKKIGIDARLYSQTGVGVYISNLLFYLEKLNLENIVFYIYLLDRDFDKVNFKNKNFVKRKANYFWHGFFEQIGFLKTLNEDKLDLMHFTYFSYPIFYKRPFIVTIHDLTLLLFKSGKSSTKNPFIYEMKYFLFQKILLSQVKNSKAIITPTKTVKKQIVNYYGKKYDNKIYPIYEGINYQLKKTEENKSLFERFSKPFFIYVGNFYPHKNVENLIKAFAKVKKGYQLILIGPEDFFTSRLLQFNIKLEQEKRIKFFHYSKLEDLVFFYKYAKALIHPSLSEGFGLPIVEATYFKLPIIASNIEVFRELLGDQFISFDQKNVEDIAAKINNFINHPVKFDYSKLMPKYSFEKMTRETVKIYNQF